MSQPAVPYLGTGHALLMKSGAHTGEPKVTVTGPLHAGLGGSKPLLESIEVDATPFDPAPPGALARRAHWVEPRLVAEVQFTERTGDGKIRHPSLQGFRTDKRPADVRREREVDSTT